MLDAKKMFIGGIIISFVACAAMSAPRQGRPIDRAGLKEGIYDGAYKWGPNKVKVQVSIARNEITDIKIIEHTNLKGKKAEESVIKRIIENQSTDVDAVGGATNSSHVIMNAVQEAVLKAY